MPPVTRAAAAPPCLLLALPRALQEKIEARVAEQRDLAALASTCRALWRAVVFPRARVVLAADKDTVKAHGGSAAVPLKRREQWALSAMARAQVVELQGCTIEQLSGLLRTRRAADRACRSLREIRLPTVRASGLSAGAKAEAVDSLRSIEGLPSGCSIVIEQLVNPLPAWVQPGTGGPILAALSYVFHMSGDRSAEARAQNKAACEAAALVPSGASVSVLCTPATADAPTRVRRRVASLIGVLAGRGLSELSIGVDYEFAGEIYGGERDTYAIFVGKDLARALGLVDASSLQLDWARLSAAAARAMAQEIAARSSVRRLGLSGTSGNKRHLIDALATAQHPFTLDELSVGFEGAKSEDSHLSMNDDADREDDFASLLVSISGLLDRVFSLKLLLYFQPTRAALELRIESDVLRSLELVSPFDADHDFFAR